MTLNSSTFFCGQYGYSFWPIWSFRVADVVVPDVVVGNMVCGRYGTDPPRTSSPALGPHHFLGDVRLMSLQVCLSVVYRLSSVTLLPPTQKVKLLRNVLHHLIE